MKGRGRPILVTGSHRSGTTWVGRILASAPGAAYIDEPFNVDLRPSVNPRPFADWFTYLCDENAGDYRAIFASMLRFRYPFACHLAGARSARKAAKRVLDGARFAFHAARRARPILKDPIAVFSAEWLARAFDMEVVVLVRHPAAFCASLKAKGWAFDVRHLLRQPLLMERHLAPWRGAIEAHAAGSPDIVEQGILLWNCIYGHLDGCRARHPDWLFLKHEDLSADPPARFRPVFERLGLRFAPRVARRIARMSGPGNPVEPADRRGLVRDSRANIGRWKRRLSAEEIRRIRDGTADVAPAFYAGGEW